jgi:hypothetical protein
VPEPEFGTGRHGDAEMRSTGLGHHSEPDSGTAVSQGLAPVDHRRLALLGGQNVFASIHTPGRRPVRSRHLGDVHLAQHLLEIAAVFVQEIRASDCHQCPQRVLAGGPT